MKYCFYILTFLIFLQQLKSEEFFPPEGESLDYIKIFFEWPQMSSGEIDYLLYISNLTTDTNWVSQHTINAYLLEEFLEWGMEYRWQICYNSTQGSDCLEPIFFSINDLPESYPDNILVHQLNDEEYTPGLNFVVIYNSGNTFVMDKAGNPIWYLDKSILGEPNFYASQFLPNGNIVAHSEYPLSGYGYEIDLNGNAIFSTQGDSHHHDFIKSSKGTYFGIKNEWDYIENICEDQDPEYIYWQGDGFYEYDTSGNTLWEWHAGEYINYSEYNPDYCEGIDPNVVDWTHANSVFYDQQTNSVLVSLRNISRLINIDYETGNINWQIGQEEYMDTVDYAIDFEFSGQHAAEFLENGNILFYDNHSYQVPNLSRCVEYEYDSTYSIFSQVWEFVLADSLFGFQVGECDRLDNGHTLINSGNSGHIIEINEDDEIVWDISFYRNNQRLRLVCSERVTGLYPVAFNVFVENFHYPITTLVNNSIEILLTNFGWLDNLFMIEVTQENQLIYLDSVFVESDSTADWSINFNDQINDTLAYVLTVYPKTAPSKAQEVNIVFSDSILNAYVPDDDIYIYSIYPNPFNSKVQIKYSIPEDGDVVFDIYNILGENVDQIIKKNQLKGKYQFQWRADQYASGTYFLKLSSGQYSQFQKLTLLK